MSVAFSSSLVFRFAVNSAKKMTRNSEGGLKKKSGSRRPTSRTGKKAIPCRLSLKECLVGEGRQLRDLVGVVNEDCWKRVEGSKEPTGHTLGVRSVSVVGDGRLHRALMTTLFAYGT